ncbi:MAG: alpha/beta hydrolase [Pseudomonadota bacterium]
MKWGLRIFAGLIVLALGAYLWAEARLKPLDEAARAAAPGAFVELSAGQIHYRWDGPEDGPVLVLVHGFSTPNFIYEQNVEALTAAGFRTLRYDHFGRGWSDRPHTRYDIDFYDQALVELIDAVGIDAPFGLAGLSMGGPIVAEFTARRPEQVERLLLLVPAGLDTAGADGAAATLISTPVIGDWIWRMAGRGILLGDPQYDESARAPENRLRGDVTEQLEYRGYLQALLSTLRHMPMAGRQATFKRLAATGVPVLAIYGDADETVLVSSAETLRGLLPEADVRVVEGGEHGLNYQMHGLINPWIVDWFSARADQ